VSSDATTDAAGNVGAVRSRWLPGHVAVAAIVVVLMLAVWAALAVLYSGIGGGKSVTEVRSVMESVTSTRATSGGLAVQGVLATEAYFEVADRGDQFFGLAPEQNLITLTQAPGAFDALDLGAEALAFDPEAMLPLLLMVDTHEGEIPDAASWVADLRLSLDGVPLPPAAEHTVAFRSDHHLTLALEFPRLGADGAPIDLEREGSLELAVPDFEGGAGTLVAQWALPLESPAAAGGGSLDLSLATMAGIVAIMGGLLVVFSPCAVHMTAFFLPVVTGLGMQEIAARKDDRDFRTHVALSGFAFVAGFVLLYTFFGFLAGIAGQFFSDTAAMEPLLMPVRLVAGAVVIYLGLQTLGIFKLPFVIGLRLPGRPHQLSGSARQGYVGAAIAGMTVSFGCLVCVGGTLLAVLLVYAGASSSAITGGLTLFLFSLGMSLPFLLAAVAFDKVLPRFMGARSLLHYSTPIAGAMMLVLGLLIISGNDNLFEEFLV
jgi:cytochrome c-type biogenesis protein